MCDQNIIPSHARAKERIFVIRYATNNKLRTKGMLHSENLNNNQSLFIILVLQSFYVELQCHRTQLLRTSKTNSPV